MLLLGRDADSFPEEAQEGGLRDPELEGQLLIGEAGVEMGLHQFAGPGGARIGDRAAQVGLGKGSQRGGYQLQHGQLQAWPAMGEDGAVKFEAEIGTDARGRDDRLLELDRAVEVGIVEGEGPLGFSPHGRVGGDDEDLVGAHGPDLGGGVQRGPGRDGEVAAPKVVTQGGGIPRGHLIEDAPEDIELMSAGGEGRG